MTVLAVVFAGLGYYNSHFGDKDFNITSYLPINLGEKKVEAFRMVPTSISKSGDIVITLPKNLYSTENIEEKIIFIPEIKGEWLSQEENNHQLVYKPAEYMEVGSNYEVIIETDEGNYAEDFKIDEDPKILSILPSSDTEVSEDSEITIIFNRPMVPLTTLDVSEAWDIPVEISPETEGRWKWISTRALQFIPNDTLIPSANYVVKVKSDFMSADHVPVSGVDYKFMTRNLRVLTEQSDRKVVYNKPYELRFNQPVDLDKTAGDISLKKDEEERDFIVQYGYKDLEDGKKEEDKSIINIFNAIDINGREKFWDTDGRYEVKFNTAYPLEGDILLEEENQFSFEVTNIVYKLTAESENSGYVRSDLFDPTGTLSVLFYEDIDLLRSSIKSDLIKSSDYGEKCKDENISLDSDSCERIKDYQKVDIEFYSDRMERGQNYEISLEKIMNRENIQINSAPLPIKVGVIPGPQVVDYYPKEKDVELRIMHLCSNVPIKEMEEKYFSRNIKSNHPYKIFSWDKSYLVTNPYTNSCNRNVFQTNLSVGLDPFTDYEFEFDLEDSFGEKFNAEMEFTTEDIRMSDLSIYNVLDSYTVTVPEKTKLMYVARNLDYVDLSICKLEAYDLLYAMEGRDLDWGASPESIKGCTETASDQIHIKTDYWTPNYFSVDLKKYFNNAMGHYIISLSNPKIINQYGDKRKRYTRSFVTVTNLSIVESKVENWNVEYDESMNLLDDQSDSLRNIYWVTNIGNLTAVEGAEVKLFATNSEWPNENNFKLDGVAKYITDEDGIAETKVLKNIAGAIVRKDDDSAIVSKSSTRLRRNSSSMNDHRYYVYSDRPIYKPGDRVNIKGVLRDGYDGSYTFTSGEKKMVTLFDAEFTQVAEREVVISDYGTFGVYFDLGDQASLGEYRVEIDDMGVYYFDVEEYKPAAFKVDVSSLEDEYIAGDMLDLDINAEYYFGAKVDVEEIEYTIVSQNYFFDRYEDEYYSFSDVSDCRWDCYYGDQFIMRKKLDISDSDGDYKLQERIDFDKFFKDEEDRTSKIFSVNITVKSTDGEYITARESFIVHVGDFYMGLKTDKYFVGKKEKFNVKVQSVDMEGNIKSVGGAELTVNKVDWVQNKRQEVDGAYYNRWERQLKAVKKISVNTDKKGQWEQEIELLEEGVYILKIEKKTGNGVFVRSSTYLYVYGDGHVDIRNNNNSDLDLEIDKKNLAVGDKGSVIIKSPYDNSKALVEFIRGDIYSYEVLDISQNLYKYDFDVIDKYYPNIFVSVVLLSDTPEVKYGEVEFNVSSLMNTLNIDVKTDKERYLPGEDVNVDVEVTDLKGNPVYADLSLAVVDMSVLALKGNKKKTPVDYFYGGFPLTVSTSSNIKNILYELDVEDRTKGGGGAKMMADAAMLDKKKRGEFRDTAYWQSVVLTDGTGVAKSEFALPDNMTTWQLELVAVTKDTKVGSVYKEIIAKKDVLVEPLEPRFVVSGDVFKIGAQVFNQTDQDKDMEVSFSSDSLSFDGSGLVNLSIEANASDTIFFDVSAPLNTGLKEHKYTISVRSGDYEDTIEKTIPIKNNDTYEFVSTSSYSDNPDILEYLYIPENIIQDKGTVQIRANATLADFISDALENLIDYPYGGTEQIATKLYSIAIVSGGMKDIGLDGILPKEIEYDNKKYTIDELVNLGLDQLMEKQNEDGSFAYYKWLDGNYYLSLHVLDALVSLRDSGYKVSDDLIDSTYDYIIDRYDNDIEISGQQDATIQTALVLSKIKPIGEFYKLTTRIKEIADSDAYIEDGMSSLSLVNLAYILNKNNDVFMPNTIEKIFKALDNRLRVDSRGSYLRMIGDRFFDYYETPIRDTALLLKTYLEANKEPVILDQIIRWIINSQSKDGSWGSTMNTLSVVEAMSKYLEKTDELNTEFDLKTYVNDEEQSSYSFNRENIFSDNDIHLNLKTLNFGALNKIKFEKDNKNGGKDRLYYDISLKYFLPIDNIEPRDEGFLVSREFYAFNDKDYENPIYEASLGDIIRGRLKIINPDWRKSVSIEDFIPAGTEIINFDLETTDDSILSEEEVKYATDILIADHTEYRDDRIFMFIQNLSPGEYAMDYFLRVSIPGKFIHLPAVVYETYFPENFGRTEGRYFIVEEME